MTDIASTDAPMTITPVPERVRVSVLTGGAQADVSLPLDVHVATLAPQIVTLVRKDASPPLKDPAEARPDEAVHDVCTLTRSPGTAALAPERTLRDMGVVDGDVLRLSTQRPLSAPTLYDDVVDAAARLNKASYPSWDAAAACWMAFAGVYAGSASCAYFLLADAFASHRSSMIALSIVAAALLVGTATVAHRSHGRPDVGAAFGWAALPVAAAITWRVVSPLGGYWVAGGCAAMVLLAVALFWVVGCGRWGYLACGVAFGCGAVAVAVHALGIRADVTGATLAVAATMGCMGVPTLTARVAQWMRQRRDGGVPAGPSVPSPTGHDGAADADRAPAVYDLAARVRAAAVTRAGLLSGLAVSAGTGTFAVLRTPASPSWAALTFATGCAITLGLFARLTDTALERAALVIPATALIVVSAWRAGHGGPSMALAALASLLVVAIACAWIAADGPGARSRQAVNTALAYALYVATAALIPLAWWAIGTYAQLGFT
jgi:type VII secretion integral membrane protein EccD